MVRVSFAALLPFYRTRQPLDFNAGYANFINRTVSNVVAQATPSVIAAGAEAGSRAGALAALTIFTDLGRKSSSGQGNSLNIGNLNLSYGQGIASIGGKTVITNEAGKGGSTSAAKAILASYNAYKGRL